MMEIVAEVGPCNGYVTDALNYVDACADLDITMKVQWYNRDTLVTRDAPRYDHTDLRRITQYEMFAETIDCTGWREVFQYADHSGVEIFPSVFDLGAVTMAREFGVRRLKIASASLRTNWNR